jgi:putative PEP-CTERM system TPR-repeat lipoprotein
MLPASRRFGRRRLFAVVLIAVAYACSAQAKTTRQLERGDGFFDQKKYREASLEYRNVVDAEPNNVRALQRLGITYFELGEMGRAFVYLNRANQLDDTDTEVRWRLGLLNAWSRQPDEARRHANFVLQKDPDNLEALGVLAETAETLPELDAAIDRVEAVRGKLAQREKASRLLGGLFLKKGDLAKAEAALQDAVSSAPQSVEAHTALATLHMARRQTALAEKEFRAAADVAPAASPARQRLADFYLGQRRYDEGRKVLNAITAENPDDAPAWLRLAELALLERKYDEANQAVQAILEKNPLHRGGLQLRAQVRLEQGQIDEAIQQIQAVIKQDPKFAPAHFQLGLAHLRAGNQQLARAALKQAITLSPDFAQAAVRLAELNLQANAPDAAIEDLNKLLQSRPGVPRAYELLGAAYLQKGDAVRATEAYQKFQQLVPAGDPRTAYYLGLALRAQGKRAEARKAFEQSLAAAPGAPDPLNQLVDMAFDDKQPDFALAVARKQAQAAPASAAVQAVLARVFQRRGELAQAEAAHQKAIALDPRSAWGHLELGKLYVATRRPDQALAETEKALQIDPKSAEAWLLYGQIQEQKGDMAKAQDAFKKALDIDPRHASAANNLAWVYSEQGGNADEALRLAQLAKQLAPDDPHVSDTLGWILYKRGVYQQALNVLKESAAKLPDNAPVHFHLGMTYYKLGDKPAAGQALKRALELDATFADAAEARRVLSTL